MVRVILAVAVLMVPPLAECFDVGGATVHCVAVYLRRAFLCAGSRLLEASWPDVPAHAARPFAPAYSRATPSNMEPCAAPIAPIAAEVEAARGRLWVLDAGDDRCAPQVFVYDVRLNKEVWRCPLEDVPSGAVRALAVDVEAPVGGEVGGGGGVRAYVGDSGRGGLVVVALRERRFWFLDVHAPCEPGGVHALSLAIARRPVLPTLRTAHALPWAECLFLLDPAGDELLALDLATERARPPPPVYDRRPEAVRCEARCVGRLLGSPAAMAFDFRQGLHYFLNRDAAALRWDARRPLQAEAHQVLLQDADVLPSVRQYFMDSQRNVWALIGTSEPETEDNEIDYAHAAEHTNKYPNTISHSRNPSYSQPPHSEYPVHSQGTLATPSESPPNTPDLTPSSKYSSNSVQGISSDSLTPHSGYLYDSPSPSTYPIINTESSKYPPASPPLYPPQTPPIISPDATYSPPNTLPSPPASPASPSSPYSPNIYPHAVQNIPPSSPFSPPIVPPLEFQPPTDAPPAVIYSPLDVPPAVPTGRRLSAATRHAPAARGRPLQAKGSAGAEGRAWKRGRQSGDYEDDECHVMNARSNCFSVPNDLLFIQANAKSDPAGGSAGQLVRQPEVQSPSTSGFVVSRPADALPPPPPLDDPPPLPPPPPPPAPLTGNPQDPDPPRTLFNQLTAPLPALAPNPSLTRSARQLSGETVVGSVVTESAHAIPDATQGTIVVQEDMGDIHGNVIGAQQRSVESVDFGEEPINESGLPPLSTQHSNDYVGKARSEREIVGGEQNSVDGKHTVQKGVEKMMGQDVNEERLNDSIENVGSAKENDEESIIEMIQELHNNGENNMETITVDKEKINNDEKGRLANPEYGKTNSTDHIFVDTLHESNTTNNQEKIKRVQEMGEDTDDGMHVQENFKNNNENIESKHVIIIDNQEQLNNDRDVTSNIEHDSYDYSQKIQDTNSKASKKTEQLLPTTVSLLPTIERYELKNRDKSELLGDRNQLEGMKITNVDLEDKDVAKEVNGDFPVNEEKQSELMEGKQQPTRGVRINQNDKSTIENIIEKQTNNKHQLSPSTVNQAHHSLEREQRSISDRASKDVHLYPENISTAKAINVPEQTVSCDSHNTKNKDKFTNKTSEDALKEISGGERVTLDSKSESIALDDALHGQLGNECEREFKDHVKRQANSNKKSSLTHHLYDETHTYSENNDNSNINMFGNFEEQNKPQGHFVLHISDETKANIYNKPTKSENNDIKSQKPTVGTFTTQETLTKSDYFEKDIKERNNDMRSEEIKEKHNKPLDSIVKTASYEIKCEKVPYEKLRKPYEEVKEEETLLERNKREKNFGEKEADNILKEANKIKSHLVSLTPIPDTQINIVEQLEEGNTLKESTPSKDVFSEDRMEGVRPALPENGNTNYAVEKLNNKNNYKEIENMQHLTEKREDNEMKVETKSVPNETFTLNAVGHDQGSKNKLKEVNGASNPSADTKDEYISSGSKPYNLGEKISYKTSDTENMMYIDEAFDDLGKTLVSENLNTYYSKDQLQEEGTNENFKTTRDIALINNDKQTSLEPSNYSKENNREISSSDTLRKGAENIKNIFEQDIDSLDHSLPRIYRHLNSAELIPSDTPWGPDQLAEKNIDERYQESLKQAEEPLYINKHPQTTINHTNNIHVLSKKEKRNTQRNKPAANTGINVDEHHIESKANKGDTCYISNSFTKETREPLDNELNSQSIKENISIRQDNVNKPPEESYTIKKFQAVSDRVDMSPYTTHNVNEEVDPVISIPSVISVENVPMNAFQILIPPDYSQKPLNSVENSNVELQKEINLQSQNPEQLTDKSSEIFSLQNAEVNILERSHITSSTPENLSLQRPFNEVKTHQSFSSADLEWVVTGTVRPEHGVCASLPQCKAHSPRNMGKPPKLYSKKPETTEKIIKEILNSPENGGINDQPRVREIIVNSQEGDTNNPKMTEDINLGTRFYSSLAQIAEEILDKTKEKVANNNDASKTNSSVSTNLNIPSVFELISTTQTTQGENKKLQHTPLQNFDVLDEEFQNNINKENIFERNIILKKSDNNGDLMNIDNENNHRMEISGWQQRKPSFEEGRDKKIEEKIDEILPKEKYFPQELSIYDENSRKIIEISEVQNKIEGEDGRRYFERTTEKSSEKEEVVPQNKEGKKVTKSKSTHFHGRKMLGSKEQEQDFCFPDKVLKRHKVLIYNSNAEKKIKKNDNEASCVTHLDQVSFSNENDHIHLEKNKKELEEKAHAHDTCLIKSAFHEASNENLKIGSEPRICLNQFESPSPSTKTDTFTNHGDSLSSSQMTALRALKRIDPSVRSDSYSNAKHTDYEMNDKNSSKSKTHNSSNASFDDNGGLHHEAIHRIENEYVDYNKPRVNNITRENTEKEEQNSNEKNEGTMHKIKNGGGKNDDDNESNEKENVNSGIEISSTHTKQPIVLNIFANYKVPKPEHRKLKSLLLPGLKPEFFEEEEEEQEEELGTFDDFTTDPIELHVYINTFPPVKVVREPLIPQMIEKVGGTEFEIYGEEQFRDSSGKAETKLSLPSDAANLKFPQSVPEVNVIIPEASAADSLVPVQLYVPQMVDSRPHRARPTYSAPVSSPPLPSPPQATPGQPRQHRTMRQRTILIMPKTINQLAY